jgi:hypothetical protein
MKSNKTITVELEFEEDFADKDHSYKLSTSNKGGTFPVEMHAYSKKELSAGFFKGLRKFVDQSEAEWKKEAGK